MKRNPKPFLQGPPVLWRCSLLSLSLKREACDYNRERIAKALKGGRNDVEALSARIQLKPCDGCPGVLVRYALGLEPQPKEIQPLAALVSKPPARITRQVAERMAVILNRDNPLARYRPREIRSNSAVDGETGPRPTDGSARYLNNSTQRFGVIYYERVVNGVRHKFSLRTRDWAEAIRLRDAYEREQGISHSGAA